MSKSLYLRLESLAAWVIPGEVVADVACDHGLLLETLLRQGVVPRGIGIDLREAPLERARRALCGLNAELRLGDGLGPLRAGEAATAVIAGLHGQKIRRFVDQHGDKVRRLVLGPHGGDELVRAGLPGWAVLAEQVVEEAGHLYPILVMEPGAERRSWLYYGDPARHVDRIRLAERVLRDRERLSAIPSIAAHADPSGAAEIEGATATVPAARDPRHARRTAERLAEATAVEAALATSP